MMGFFKKSKPEVPQGSPAEPAAKGIQGLGLIVNPNPRSESSYRRHVGRRDRLLLAIEKAELKGETERTKILKIELQQRELAIKQWEIAQGR